MTRIEMMRVYREEKNANLKMTNELLTCSIKLLEIGLLLLFFQFQYSFTDKRDFYLM